MTADKTRRVRPVTGGNITPAPPAPITWRTRLGYHLFGSILIMGVAVFGCWVCSPTGDLQNSIIPSVIITAWCNILIFITLARR